jgi:hypothetical protein
MSEKISTELNYSPVVSNHSTVLYRKISPQGSSTAIPLSATSSIGPVEIVVPPSVWNPSRSKLNFQIELEAPGANLFNYLNANGLTALSRVVVYDAASGAVWCDVSNFEKYAGIVPHATHIDEFLTKGGQNVLVGAAAGANPGDATNGVKSLANTSAVSTARPSEDIVKCNATANSSFTLTDLGSATTGVNPILGRRQMYSNSIANDAGFIDFSIPFSAFKFTALALDKMIYNPAQTVIQLYFSPTDNFVWKASNAMANIASVANALLNNVSITCANEGNLAIVSQVINKVMTSGLSLPIAYPSVSRIQLTSSAHSYTVQLTRAYGSRILGIITVPYNAGATLNLRNDHAIPTNLTTFNTFMNGVALKYPNGFDVRLCEDWKFNVEPFLKNTAVQNIGEFRLAEYAFIDSFFGDKPLCEVDQTEIDGLAVTEAASTWQIQADFGGNATTINYVTIILGQKTLSLSSSGSLVQ